MPLLTLFQLYHNSVLLVEETCHHTVYSTHTQFCWWKKHVITLSIPLILRFVGGRNMSSHCLFHSYSVLLVEETCHHTVYSTHIQFCWWKKHVITLSIPLILRFVGGRNMSSHCLFHSYSGLLVEETCHHTVYSTHTQVCWWKKHVITLSIPLILSFVGGRNMSSHCLFHSYSGLLVEETCHHTVYSTHTQFCWWKKHVITLSIPLILRFVGGRNMSSHCLFHSYSGLLVEETCHHTVYSTHTQVCWWKKHVITLSIPLILSFVGRRNMSSHCLFHSYSVLLVEETCHHTVYSTHTQFCWWKKHVITLSIPLILSFVGRRNMSSHCLFHSYSGLLVEETCHHTVYSTHTQFCWWKKHVITLSIPLILSFVGGRNMSSHCLFHSYSVLLVEETCHHTVYSTHTQFCW